MGQRTAGADLIFRGNLDTDTDGLKETDNEYAETKKAKMSAVGSDENSIPSQPQ